MREKQMKKKIRCPECSDTWITMWRSGEMGYRAYYDEILQEVTYDEDTLEYDELAFEIFSCSKILSRCRSHPYSYLSLFLVVGEEVFSFPM